MDKFTITGGRFLEVWPFIIRAFLRVQNLHSLIFIFFLCNNLIELFADLDQDHQTHLFTQRFFPFYHGLEGKVQLTF